MPVFTWDPVTDKFLFAGKGSSYLLEEKLAVMRGLPKSKINEIYDELEMRKEYIQLLVDKKIFEYDRVFRAVIYAGQVGIEKALRDLKSGSFTP
jgi:flagellar protein FlaI